MLKLSLIFTPMQAYLDIALRAALEAGREILRIYTDPASDFQVERKADNSPLTIADRTAHEVIMRHLQETPFPVLSEEGRHDSYELRRSWKTFWCVDPLDGSKEFIKQNGMFSVNIALVVEGVPTLGVVFFPAAGTVAGATIRTMREPESHSLPQTAGLLYWTDGTVSRRALVDDCSDVYEIETLPVQAEQTGRPYTVVASASHMSEETEAYIDALRAEHPDLRLVQAGSSLKICRVAEGSADIYPRLGLTSEWDTAAGHAVARAAGFDIVSHEDGLTLRYNKPDILNPFFIVK